MQKLNVDQDGIFLIEKYRFDEPLKKEDAPKIVDVCRNFGTIDSIIALNTESGLDAYNETFNDVDDFVNIGLPDDKYVDGVSFNLIRTNGSCTISINLLANLLAFQHFKSEDLKIEQFASYLEKEVKKKENKMSR